MLNMLAVGSYNKKKHFNQQNVIKYDWKMLKNLRKINSFRLEFAVAILNSLMVNKVSSFLNMAAIPVNNAIQVSYICSI